MPRVHNWEEWDEVEEQLQNEQVRQKLNGTKQNRTGVLAARAGACRAMFAFFFCDT